MFIGGGGGDSSAAGAGNKALLQEERLDDVFEGVSLFAEGGGYGFDAGWAAFMGFD